MKENNLSVVHKASGEIVTPEEKTMYDILKKLPAPSFKFSLNKDQKYWYAYFGEELIKTNQLTKVDIIHLTNLAVAADIYFQAVKAMNDKGYHGGIVQKFNTGAEQISPHIVAQTKALNQIKEISAHFGFGFKDRQKLNLENPNTGQLSLFETIANKLAQ